MAESTQKKNAVIVWFRRDLRLSDNPALHHAIDTGRPIIPVYIHDPDAETPWQPGAASNWWLHQSLASLNESLLQQHNKLHILQGTSLSALLGYCREYSVDTIFWNRLYDPTLVSRDKLIKSVLAENGIQSHSFNGSLLREPWEVSKDNGQMYRVFTPFSKRYPQLGELRPPLESPRKHALAESISPAKPGSVALEQLGLLPKINWHQGFNSCWQPGEQGAQDRLNQFLDQSIFSYAVGRDLPAIDGVSGLSPHLHFGEISSRQIWFAVQYQIDMAKDNGVPNPEENANSYLRQLIWRDFAHHILFHLPHTSEQPFNEKFQHFQWEQNEALLAAWQQGQTGIPLVDAGMRQLWQTGWMHNRVRMVVASVLTKNGLQHWLEGARWFWDTLLDANLANNSMGWQWTAGCGVDAAPYFRIFSPERQGQRFDPLGEYVRTWVPELKTVPVKFIHCPGKASHTILADANVELGKDYPYPAIDLSTSRQEALQRFKLLR